jgi:hypothetical protein
VGLLLLLASIAVLTVVFDRGRFWWQWWRKRASRNRQWWERLQAGAGGGEQTLEDWEREMAFGEPVLQAGAVLAPLLGLIGTVLGLMEVLAALGAAYGATAATVAYAWILRHPARPVPVTGTGRIEGLREAAAALALRLSAEDWYRVWQASVGHEVA